MLRREHAAQLPIEISSICSFKKRAAEKVDPIESVGMHIEQSWYPSKRPGL
jgi:hypothetical protein